jgi:hypothetical protein
MASDDPVAGLYEYPPTKLYVLVRRDLSPAQRAVQSMHAVAELMLRDGADP